MGKVSIGESGQCELELRSEWKEKGEITTLIFLLFPLSSLQRYNFISGVIHCTRTDAILNVQEETTIFCPPTWRYLELELIRYRSGEEGGKSENGLQLIFLRLVVEELNECCLIE